MARLYFNVWLSIEPFILEYDGADEEWEEDFGEPFKLVGMTDHQGLELWLQHNGVSLREMLATVQAAREAEERVMRGDPLYE